MGASSDPWYLCISLEFNKGQHRKNASRNQKATPNVRDEVTPYGGASDINGMILPQELTSVCHQSTCTASYALGVVDDEAVEHTTSLPPLQPSKSCSIPLLFWSSSLGAPNSTRNVNQIILLPRHGRSVKGKLTSLPTWRTVEAFPK